jgi:hypothetical protein
MLAEETLLELLTRPCPRQDQIVASEARRLNALPVGSDLWSHFFLRPDGALIRVNLEGIADGHEREEVFVDRAHSLWGLVVGSQLYPELGKLIPPREPGSDDCECKMLGPQFSMSFCPRCGGVGWLPPSG